MPKPVDEFIAEIEAIITAAGLEEPVVEREVLEEMENRASTALEAIDERSREEDEP